MQVDVLDMLRARDKRAERQKALLIRHKKPLICLCLNIAGAIKVKPLYMKLYNRAVEKLEILLSQKHWHIIEKTESLEKTGYEAIYAVDGNAKDIKEALVLLEQTDSLGRLLDLDVIDENFNKLSRNYLRPCLVCGKTDGLCSAKRLHSADEVMAKTDSMITKTLNFEKAQNIALIAQKALLYELSVSPKPGLVDRLNSGSHQDMDFYSFIDSSVSLYPYFFSMSNLGLSYDKSSDIFPVLRQMGQLAEGYMLKATSGVNTHRGAIFSLGLACFALAGIENFDIDVLFTNIQNIAAKHLTEDFDKALPKTAGLSAYKKTGVKGARGEAILGFPTVRLYMFPAFQKALKAGLNLNDAGVYTLLCGMSKLDDTNLIKRGGIASMEKVKSALSDYESLSIDEIRHLDYDFIELNLSPGGAADMLALCFFLHFAGQFHSSTL